MAICIDENELNLYFRKTIKVKNARRAYAAIQRFMDSKRLRGMRLRYLNDTKTNTLILQGQSSIPVHAAISFLKDRGEYIKQIGNGYINYSW